MTKKEQKRLDQLVQDIVSKHCSGVQINIMDIPKVFLAAYAAHDVGNADMVSVVVNAYRSLEVK